MKHGHTVPNFWMMGNCCIVTFSQHWHALFVAGCTTLRLQKQIEVFQNIPLSQVAELNCPSNDTNNYNMNNNFSINTHNGYTAPQTQYSCSEFLYPPITTSNNHSAKGSTSNCGSSKFPEPYSPATLATSDVIATLAEDKCIPQRVEPQHHLIALHDVQEKKFTPREQKFNLPGSSNEIKLWEGGCERGLDGISLGLTCEKTIDVTTLNNWPGDYDFQLKVVPNDKHKNKVCGKGRCLVIAS